MQYITVIKKNKAQLLSTLYIYLNGQALQFGHQI